MIQALLKNKLTKEFKRPTYTIEDLLTSVVLGSCVYAPHDKGIIPFLRNAKKISGKSCMSFQEVLNDVVNVEYMFWPDWKEEKATRNRNNDGTVYIAASEPELILVMHRKKSMVSNNNPPDVWILIEVKLDSSKSSVPCQEKEYVTDQLAKYWLQLKERAEESNAIPLCVIYLTKHNTPPMTELSETQTELKDKIGIEAEAPLFWLSWRKFVGSINTESSPLLKDVSELLIQKWALIPFEEMKPWQDAPVIPDVYIFTPWMWHPANSDVLPNWQFVS